MSVMLGLRVPMSPIIIPMPPIMAPMPLALARTSPHTPQAYSQAVLTLPVVALGIWLLVWS
jgi:hypothetical protein